MPNEIFGYGFRNPDEEFLAEIREDGGDPEAMAAQCREIFEKVKADV